MSSLKKLQSIVKAYHLNVMEYDKRGLRHDDLYNPEHFPKVQYVLSQLPKHLQYSKNYRMCKAVHYAYNDKQAPEEEHVNILNDVPYLADKITEIDEKLRYAEETHDMVDNSKLLNSPQYSQSMYDNSVDTRPNLAHSKVSRQTKQRY